MGGRKVAVFVAKHINGNRVVKTKMGANHYWNILIPQDTYGNHEYINIHMNKKLYTLEETILRRDEVIQGLQLRSSALLRAVADSVVR